MSTKTIFPATKANSTSNKLNDLPIRLILIPAFGILIPLLTGMMDKNDFTHWETKASFLYCIFISFIIWEGNRYLLFTLRSYFDWFNKPWRKIFVLLSAISFYTIPASILLLAGWYHLFKNGQIDWRIMIITALVIMLCVLFIVHVYETVFLVREKEDEMLRAEQLERARITAELEALKSQIDPHFMFNSLSTLSQLIETDPARARIFIDNLAEVYRYILLNKKKDLVFLEEELQFIKEYFSLLSIRFGNAVHLQINIPANYGQEFLLPPISLQVLIENAIKHNESTERYPLIISVEIQNGLLSVENRIRKKILHRASAQTGLQNLNERYLLTTGRSVEVTVTDTLFMVSLPVLTIH